MAPTHDPSQLPVCNRDYWKRPPNRAEGDEKEEMTFCAVGKALTAWEEMEQELAKLFLTVTDSGASSNSPVRRAFGAVESSGTRRTMILAAAEAYFGKWWGDKLVRVAFGRILEAVSWASKRRDDIAHGIVQRIILNERSFGFFLYPANYNTDRTKAFLYSEDDTNDPLYFTFTDFRYSSEDIETFADKFRELQNAVFQQTGMIRKAADGEIIFVKALLGL